MAVRREDFTDRAFADALLAKYDLYETHRLAGRLGDAPSAAEIVNRLSAGVRAGNAAAAGRDEPAESNIDPMAADDPPNFPGKPRSPFEMNNSPTVDARPRTIEEVVRDYSRQQAENSLTELGGQGNITVIYKR